MEASVRGPAEAELERLESQLEALRAELQQLDSSTAAAGLLVTTMDSALADPAALDERKSLLLGLLVTDIDIRDLAWAWISRRDAEAHVRIWTSVVSRVPEALAAAPLCLLGIAAWLAGQGALLNCCCERVLQIHPNYSMGKLLSDISAWAVPPSIWSDVRNGMRADLDAERALLAG